MEEHWTPNIKEATEISDNEDQNPGTYQLIPIG